MKVPIEPPAGLISDETTFSTPGFWVDGDKARFRNGRFEPIGGWAKHYASALEGICRGMLAWYDNQSTRHVAFGTTQGLFVLKEGVLYDITPEGLRDGFEDTQPRSEVAAWGTGGWGEGPWGGGALAQTYPRTWSLAVFGEWLVANPRGKGIYIWQNDTAAKAELISEAPISVNSILVTPQRQLVAFGCHEELTGQYNPSAIRGSALGNGLEAGGIFNWTVSTDNNAFEHVLEGGSRIVGAELIGDYIGIWTDTAFHLGEFLGYSDQTYNFRPLGEGCGLAAQKAVCIINDTAYWPTPNFQFYGYTAGAAPVLLPCPIRNDFKDNVYAPEMDKMFACSVGTFGEAWFFYPDARDGDEVSRYVSLSPTQGAWSKGLLDRTSGTDRLDSTPIMVGTDRYAYDHETGISADGDPLDWFIKLGGQYLMSGDVKVKLKEIWPDFEDQVGTVELEFHTQNYPQSEEKNRGPYLLKAGREKKDIRLQGRIVGLTLRNYGVAYARQGRMMLEAQTGGRR